MELGRGGGYHPLLLFVKVLQKRYLVIKTCFYLLGGMAFIFNRGLMPTKSMMPRLILLYNAFTPTQLLSFSLHNLPKSAP